MSEAWGRNKGAELDARLIRQGVPPRLLRFCGENSLGRALVRIQTPKDITTPDLLALAGLGLGVVISPSGVFDLSELDACIAHFGEIRLGTEPGASYASCRTLERAEALETLFIATKLPEPVDLTHLPYLHSATCVGIATPSVVMNPNLRDLALQVPRVSLGLKVISPLRKLSIDAGPTLSDLNFMDDTSELEILTVSKARAFDVSSLKRCADLRVIEFVDCRELTNIESLLELPDLVSVQIFGAKEILNYQALQSLNVRAFHVEKNYVFDEKFQRHFFDSQAIGNNAHFDEFRQMQPKGVPRTRP